MCWSPEASWSIAAIGGVAAAVTMRRGEPPVIWGTVLYFTAMEVLQALSYGVIDNCGSPANMRLTVLSYLHVCLQPLVVNAFAMAIAPAPVPSNLRRWVWILAGIASAGMFVRLIPIEALGQCRPGDTLCGPAWCVVSGSWHLAWEVPLNDTPRFFGLPFRFPFYTLASFALPLLYGAWRFSLFALVCGPVLARILAPDLNEMPAVWCILSLGIVLISLSPFIRRRAMGAQDPQGAEA